MMIVTAVYRRLTNFLREGRLDLLVSSSIDSRGVFSQVRNLCWVHIPQACYSQICRHLSSIHFVYLCGAVRCQCSLKRPPARFCLSIVWD